MRIILLGLLVASCSPLYIPNTRNAPLFREQGEAQVGGYINSGGLEAQGAYAVTDHIGAIGSFAYGASQKSNPDYTRKNMYGEVGLGLYDLSRSFRYELYAGYGFGEGTSYDQYYFFNSQFGNQTLVSTGKMNKIFLQPTIGTNNLNGNIYFTPRVAWVDYSEFTHDGYTVKPDEKPVIFLEPALTGKFRLKGNIHALFQLGITAPIGDSFFEYQTMQATVGLQIDTGGLRTRVYK